MRPNQATSFKLIERPIYGSSRVGIDNTELELFGYTAPTSGILTHELGLKQYEFSNHLGNVLTTVSDKKIPVDDGNNGTIDWYVADITSASDYYPFGSPMDGRTFSSDKYRFGFNGKENDNEVKGEGSQQDYGERIYDPRLGRFLSADPLIVYGQKYPELSTYQFASNCPIMNIDLDGLEGTKPPKKGTVTFVVVVNEQEVKFSFEEKSPHIIKLEVNGVEKTFNFNTIYKPTAKSKIKAEDINKNSLVLFAPQGDVFLPEAIDAMNIKSFEIEGVNVLDVINKSLEKGLLKIDIVGNVESALKSISGTKENLDNFTKNSAKDTKKNLFNNNEGVSALSIFDAIKSDATGPKEGFETISKPNDDPIGVQIFFRKGSANNSEPSF